MKKISKIKENENIDFLYRLLIDEYPEAWEEVSEVSAMLKWDIFGAMSFCLHLLEDVNAHTEMAEVAELFAKQIDKFI